MHVGVVGAGIGGATLAHALHRHGIDVTIFERDSSAHDTAGYRLHLNPESILALRRGLPDHVTSALDVAGAGTESFSQFSVFDHRGTTRLRLPTPTRDDLLMIGRRPLRSILTRDLDVRWNTHVLGYSEHSDRVTVHTCATRARESPVRASSGASSDIDVDVLVGADGTRSSVTPQLTGRPAARPAGVTAIAATVLLDEPSSPPVFSDLRKGLGFAIGPRGVGMFLAMHTPRTSAAAQSADSHDGDAEPPYLVWSVAARIDQFSADPAALRHDGLITEASHLISGWAPSYRRLISASVAGSGAAFPFWFPATLRQWRSDRVTLLGDAIHPMPPTAGAGASTAIIDAVHLAEDLATHARPEALRRYQARMLTYAPAAVREAVPALTWQRRFGNPVLRALGTRVVMPVAQAVISRLSR